ncbi:hypothetical protein L9F63_024921, partial [Diploptera punctata]
TEFVSNMLVTREYIVVFFSGNWEFKQIQKRIRRPSKVKGVFFLFFLAFIGF